MIIESLYTNNKIKKKPKVRDWDLTTSKGPLINYQNRTSIYFDRL